MINYKHKFIFIHINKCGGTTLDTLIPKSKFPSGVHNDASWYMLNFPQKFNSYFKFTTVRNPWAKAVSFYYYHVGRNWNLNWDWDVTNAPTFKEFVKITSSYTKQKQESIFQNTQSPCTYSKRMSNQLDWITDENGDILVDYIMRLETLQEDFDIVCDKIGIPRQKLPCKNKSKHKHYTEYYDDETRALTAEKYARDIEYFGYEFGE